MHSRIHVLPYINYDSEKTKSEYPAATVRMSIHLGGSIMLDKIFSVS